MVGFDRQFRVLRGTVLLAISLLCELISRGTPDITPRNDKSTPSLLRGYRTTISSCGRVIADLGNREPLFRIGVPAPYLQPCVVDHLLCTRSTEFPANLCLDSF